MPATKKIHEICSPGITELPPLPMDAASLAENFRHYYTHNLGRDK
jgi:starch phosphorylase